MNLRIDGQYDYVITNKVDTIFVLISKVYENNLGN